MPRGINPTANSLGSLRSPCSKSVSARFCAVTRVERMSLPKQPATDDHCGDDSYQVSQQSRRNRMSSACDTNRPEINSYHIECGLGASINGRCHIAQQMIWSELFNQ